MSGHLSHITTEPTMSSREIAEVVESRHDSVKRAIERLYERGVIVQPPMVDEQDTDAMGRGRTTSVYYLVKRDSYVVVAQLSPEFTARLVDRWQELEARQKAQLPDFTNPVEAARAWANAQEQALTAQQEVRALDCARVHAEQQAEIAQQRADEAEEDREDAQEVAESYKHTFQRIAYSDETHAITEAAKILKMAPKTLFHWMSSAGWIFRESRSNGWKAYQDKINAGFLWVRMGEFNKPDGTIGLSKQVRVTGRGLIALAIALRGDGMDHVPDPGERLRGTPRPSEDPDRAANPAFCRWVDSLQQTQQEVANLLGISRTYATQLYRGQRSPGRAMISIIQRRSKGAVPALSWFGDGHPEGDGSVVEFKSRRANLK